MKVTKKSPIDWDNIEEVREYYAKNREESKRIFAILNTCFVFSMATSLIPAVLLTFYTVLSGAGQMLGYAIMRGAYGDEAVREGVRGFINGLPILYLAAIWLIGILSLLSKVYDLRKTHKFLRVFYPIISLFSIIGILFNDNGPVLGILCFCYGIVGFCVEDLILRQLPLLDELSKEPGFPHFLDYFDRTHTVKNTIAKYVDYKKKLEEKHEKDTHEGVLMQKAIAKEQIKPEEFELGIMPEVSVPETEFDYERGRRDVKEADTTHLFDD
ncbi:MAG: hypothetical protein LBL98_05420 [Ruminococcus sp.]|jgi:hypothetical protein|nr:hypothetical protein [Ruminococcus sp.]